MELLLAVAIMTVMVSVLYTIFNTTMRAWSTGDSRVQMLQNARILLDRLSNDLQTCTIQKDNNINLIVMANSIYFVNKAVYQNGSDEIMGFQEVGYAYNCDGANDTDFTDDDVNYFTRHSQSSSTFQYESDFSTLLSQNPGKLGSFVVQLSFECWNNLTSEWIDWNAWPGSPSTPAWNVINPVSSNDPDDINYQPSDPSNKGKMPEKIRITITMVSDDTAQWVNRMDSSSFNSYTQGQTGTAREKIIAALTQEGLVEEYTLVVALPETD